MKQLAKFILLPMIMALPTTVAFGQTTSDDNNRDDIENTKDGESIFKAKNSLNSLDANMATIIHDANGLPEYLPATDNEKPFSNIGLIGMTKKSAPNDPTTTADNPKIPIYWVGTVKSTFIDTPNGGVPVGQVGVAAGVASKNGNLRFQFLDFAWTVEKYQFIGYEFPSAGGFFGGGLFYNGRSVGGTGLGFEIGNATNQSSELDRSSDHHGGVLHPRASMTLSQALGKNFEIGATVGTQYQRQLYYTTLLSGRDEMYPELDKHQMRNYLESGVNIYAYNPSDSRDFMRAHLGLTYKNTETTNGVELIGFSGSEQTLSPNVKLEFVLQSNRFGRDQQTKLFLQFAENSVGRGGLWDVTDGYKINWGDMDFSNMGLQLGFSIGIDGRSTGIHDHGPR